MYAELFVKSVLQESEILAHTKVIANDSLSLTKTMEIEVKMNEDKDADGFLSFPTLVQIESREGARDDDFEQEVVDLARSLRADGHEVVIAAPFGH